MTPDPHQPAVKVSMTDDRLDNILDTLQGTKWSDKSGTQQLLDEAKAALTTLIKEAEREAQLRILRGFRRRDFVRDDFYEHAIIDRIGALTKEKEK